MRILHVIQSLDPATGGPPVVATKLGVAQRRLGHDVLVACYEFPGTAERIERVGMPGGRPLEVQLLGMFDRREHLFAARAKAMMPKVLDGADIVHIHGVWDPIGKVAANAARRMGVPYVVCPHGMLDPWAMSQSGWKKKLALALGYRRMLNGAAFLHCLNEDEGQLMKPVGLRCATEIIPNGIFAEEFAELPEKGEFVRRRPELEGRRYVLFLSRLNYKKGLDYLADAFAEVAKGVGDVDLVVAGPDGGEKGAFEERIKGYGLQGRVHLVGPLYGRDKLEAFVDAACFCLPSRQEGFSIAITEALAVGCPVVISENCHFPEVAQAGAGEIVPLNAHAVAGALLRVLGDEGKRKAMGEAGKRLVMERYTWPKIAEMMICAYRRALANS